jgi:alpha-tubulin suppressor-like RCC1 family protein
MVWTWGSNANGELGVGDYEPRVNPFPIVALQGKKVTKIACGGSYAMALGTDISAVSNRSVSANRS